MRSTSLSMVPSRGSFGQFLLNKGHVKARHILRANIDLWQAQANLAEVLVAQGALTQTQRTRFYAQWLGMDHVLPPVLASDPEILAQADPYACLRHGVLPLSRNGTQVRLAAINPVLLSPADLGFTDQTIQFHLVLAEEKAIHKAIDHAFGPQLTHRAQTRVEAKYSCRTWEARPKLRAWGLGVLVILALLALVIWPKPLFGVLIAIAIANLCFVNGLKFLALAAAAFPRETPPQQQATFGKRPKVSVLVPLFREPEVVDNLIQHLKALHYPKALLDVVLVLEQSDKITHRAVKQADLPPWFRVITVPDGSPRTKPRALNYALDFCPGDIIGVFDAEDAPAPDQIDKVVSAFANAPPKVACLQGVLDFFNPHSNWISRCFTIEYATWFRIILPGLQRLGVPLPLGGTTVFLRRSALEALGGWDAHNVTEDADLGLRLARKGYQTQMIQTTTREEANFRPIAWIRQRSRWQKGYMVTYLVHMRKPAAFLHDIGLWPFIAVQVLFAGSIMQTLLAPLLWSLWPGLWGAPTLFSWLFPPSVLQTLLRVLLCVECAGLFAALIAARKTTHRGLWLWAPTLHVYFMMAAVACYKAAFELIQNPFFWDKTRHGYVHETKTHATPVLAHPGMSSSVKLQPGDEGVGNMVA